jgi:hypothetical protein
MPLIKGNGPLSFDDFAKIVLQALHETENPKAPRCTCYEMCTDAACPVHGTQADGEGK